MEDPKFIPCRKCVSKRGPKPGYFYSQVQWEGKSYIVAEECDCHKEYMKTRTFYHKAVIAGIYPQSFDYDLDREYQGKKSLVNVSKLKKYALGFSDQFPDAMVYIYGPNGTQKTTLAHWVGAQVISQGKSVKFILMQNLLSLLSRDPFKKDEETSDELEALNRTDLIIVDEAFSSDKVTLYKSGYQIPFLDEFIRGRIEGQRKGILFISNTNPDQLEPQGFSRSIQDLVSRNTIAKGTALEFVDNYIQEKSNFPVKGLFD